MKVTPGRWLNTIPAENNCTQVPVDPWLTVWFLRAAWVPGPKTPFATSSLIPASNWIASMRAFCTSREKFPSQGMMSKFLRFTYRPFSHCCTDRTDCVPQLTIT